MRIKWKLRSSLAGNREHSLLYRNDKLGVQCEIHTTVRKGSHGPGAERFCRPRHYFFIDDDKRTFRTEAALTEALKEKK